MAEPKTYRQSVGDVMAELSRESFGDDDVDRRLARVTAAAVVLIRGADYADVMLVRDGGFRSVAPTADFMTDLDDVQMRHGEGPCLEAAVSDAIIRVRDLGTETRWPAFTAAARDAGLASAMTFQLFDHRGGSGALNVFSRSAGAFNADDEALGAVLATHATSVVAVGGKLNALNSALADRDVIGQAKGMLMERMGIDASQAFDLILAHSQRRGARVHDVARSIVTPDDEMAV